MITNLLTGASVMSGVTGLVIGGGAGRVLGVVAIVLAVIGYRRLHRSPRRCSDTEQRS